MTDTFHYPLAAVRYVTAPQSPLLYGSTLWWLTPPPLWVLGSGISLSLWQ